MNHPPCGLLRRELTENRLVGKDQRCIAIFGEGEVCGRYFAEHLLEGILFILFYDCLATRVHLISFIIFISSIHLVVWSLSNFPVTISISSIVNVIRILCIEFPFYQQQCIDTILSHPVSHTLSTIAPFHATQRLAAAAPTAAGMCGITTNRSAFVSPLFPKYSYALSLFYESMYPFLMLCLQCDQV